MDVGDGPATMGGRSRMTQAAVPLWRLEAAKPYHLEFENDADIVCLLLGSIDARTGYDGCHPADMRFEALTAAYHPAGGRVTVDATAVSAGFAAFAFPQALQQQMFGSDYALDRIPTSVDNITSPSIASLVAYARTVFRGIGHRDGLIVEALSQLALVDVFNCLKAVRKKTSCGPLSAREFTRLTDYVDRNIAQSLSLSELSVALDMPIVTLRRRFQRKTGLSLHQFVLERRLQVAQSLLSMKSRPLSDIAASCGFCSQQHMTTVFTRRLGLSPGAWRDQTTFKKNNVGIGRQP